MSDKSPAPEEARGNSDVYPRHFKASGNDTARSHDAAGNNFYAVQNPHARAKPHIIPNFNSLVGQALIHDGLCGIREIVIRWDEHRLSGNLHTAADPQTTLTVKHA